MQLHTPTPHKPHSPLTHRPTRSHRLRRRIAPAAALAVTLGALVAGATGTTDAAEPAAQLSNGCAVSARGIPACGAYLGAAHGSNTDPADLERRSGQRLGVRRTYFTARQVDSAVAIARGDVAAGRLPWISFKLPYSWADMAAGRGDQWARDLAQKLSRLAGPVWLAFHHEPEGDGNVQDWRRLQEHLAPIVRQNAPNVAYTVVVTGWNQFFGDPAYSLKEIWPRGVKIDVIGIDVYNEYGVVKHGSTIDEPPHLTRNYFRPLAAWAKQHDVAWGVAETGLTDEGSTRYPRWIRGAYRQLVNNDGVALTYFDTELNAYGSWPLTTATKQRDFAAALRSSTRLVR